MVGTVSSEKKDTAAREKKSRQPMQAYFALRGFGETMLKAGREREALRALEAALRINPQDAAIAQFLAARAGGPR